MNGYRKTLKRLTAALVAVLLMLPCAAPALAETFYAVVTAGDMTVYGEASLSTALGSLPKNTVVQITGYSSTIAKISYNGKAGYAKVKDLKRVDETAKKAVLNADAPVYMSAEETSKSVLAPAGTKLYLLAKSGDWAMVEKNGYIGYVKAEVVVEAGDNWDTAAADAAVNTTTGTSASGVTVRDFEAVTLAKTKVYKKPSTKAKALGSLKSGVQVTVKATSSNGWACIEYKKKYGFCKLSNLREGTATADLPDPEALAPTGKSGTVTSKTLAVYKEASKKSRKLGTLKKGQIVNVISTKNGWAYIELKGNYGYCSAKGVATDDSGVPSGFKKADVSATVISTDARVYASVSTSAESAAIKLGTEVKVVAYNDSWACISQDGQYGFIPVKLLSKASYTTIDGDGSALQTLLKALLAGGYYDAVPGTSYNAAAIAAIKRFQSACGLEQTGVADQALQRILFSGYAPVNELLYKGLASGEKGENVSRVQARLYALGYLTKTTSLDGDYGTTTMNAIKLFQTASGITANGAADTATLKALYSTEAKKLPSGTKAADASSTKTSTSSSSYLDSVPSGQASITGSLPSHASAAEKLEYVIYLAQGKLGKPYVYGATGPDKFDCSGLTTWAFKAVGVALKRSAYAQGYDESFTKIEGVPGLRRGDLVFFNTISDSDLSDHVGIYLGEGYFIHASSGGHRVVVSNLTTGFYNRVYSWGRRVL